MSHTMPRLVVCATTLTQNSIRMQQILESGHLTPAMQLELWRIAVQGAEVAVELEDIHLDDKLARELRDRGRHHTPSQRLGLQIGQLDRTMLEHAVQIGAMSDLLMLLLWTLGRLQKSAPQVVDTCEAA